MLSAYHENAARYAEQESLFIGTIKALGHTLEAKDPYTRGHSERVAQLVTQMARALGFSDGQIERYRLAGLVHDLGKIGVPESVLWKPGRLTNEEFALMQQHPIIGHRILKDIVAMEDVLPGVLHHHERWDGRGYPHGLAGKNIPLVSRILALADSFDAMMSNRSYRSALTRKQTIDEISECSGTQFDPSLVPTFVSLDFSAFDLMLQSHRQCIAA